MKKTITIFLALSLITLSLSAKEKKKYIDVVKKDFYGVDSIRWGSGYKEITGLSYEGSMGHGETLYENRNEHFGYLSSSLFSKGNKKYGFFKDRFYYLKIIYKKADDAENDLNSVTKLYGMGKTVKNSTLLINEERQLMFQSKDVKIVFRTAKDEISLNFINKRVLKEKNNYIETRWVKKTSIEGWKFLRWDMNIHEVKSLLTTNDQDYIKWGWEFRPLNKNILIANEFYETKHKFFLKIRNSQKLKCYNIHNIKKIYFLDDELFCVMINFDEADREKIIDNLKKEFGDKVKVDEFENLTIQTKGTDIYLNNNSLYYLDLDKSRKLLSGMKSDDDKI